MISYIGYMIYYIGYKKSDMQIQIFYIPYKISEQAVLLFIL